MIIDEKLVERYISGECSEAEMRQIVDWFNESGINRKEWLKLRMVMAKRNFDQCSDPEHIDRSYRELRKYRTDRELLEKTITRMVVMRLLRYAASILLLVGLSSVVYQYFTSRTKPNILVVAVSAHEPVKKISLDDSTLVWISAGSKIEFPEKFGKKERKVSVEGKIYFEVAPDAERPFFVKTDAYTVKVIGTSFDVNAFRFRQLSDVTLVEGTVEILDDQLISLCLLQAGQQFEMDKLTNQFVLRAVDAEILAAWHGGTLEFDGLTFAEIAKALERQYNVQIILEDGIAKDKKLVGSLSFEKDIHEMMRAIASVIPIKYDIQINTIVHISNK